MSSDDNKTHAYQNWLQKKPVVGRKKIVYDDLQQCVPHVM